MLRGKEEHAAIENNNWNQNRRGFTLVEIIVVLVILAILAAFTIPAMMGFVEDSRAKSFIPKAREIYEAAQSASTELYSEYSVYEEGIRHQKEGTSSGGIKYTTDTRKNGTDSSFKIDAYEKMKSRLAGDIPIEYCAYSSKFTSSNGGKYGIDVGIKYVGTTFADETHKNYWKKLNDGGDTMPKAGCIKIWYNSQGENKTPNDEDNTYNRSPEAFKVMSIWYITEDGKYFIEINQDPAKGTISTNATKRTK